MRALRIFDGAFSGAAGRRIAVVLLLGLLCASLVHVLGAVEVYDDAYITYRYVENIHQGRGAVYNEGERVCGVSSPLFLLWLTILRYATPGAEIPRLAVLGNALLLVAAGVLTFLFVRSLDLGARAASLAAVAVILSDPILRASMGGMESSLFLVLVFAGLLAQRSGRVGAALWSSSLAALTRPEGVFLIGILLVSSLLGGGRKRFRIRWLLGALPLAVWTVWSIGYYGSPLPHSIIAKAQPLYPQPAGTALMDLGRNMGHWTIGGVVAGFWLLWPLGREGEELLPAVLLQAIGLAVACRLTLCWGRAVGPPRDPGRWALPAFLLALLVLYAVTNPLMFAWYYPPFLACWIVMAVAAGLGPAVRSRFGRILDASVLTLVLVTAAASFLVALAPSGRSLLEHGAIGLGRSEVMAAYGRAADWVERHSAPADRVAAPEIGIVGFRLDRTILDACGLVTPEAIPHLPVPPEQRGDRQGVIPIDFVMQTNPEWIVTNPMHAARGLLESPWFVSRYEASYTDHVEMEGSKALAVIVFRRTLFESDAH